MGVRRLRARGGGLTGPPGAGGPPVDLRRLGDDVLAAMDGRGVSLRQAARAAGVPAATVSRLTRYGDPPSLANFARLCAWAGLVADSYVHRPRSLGERPQGET